MVRDVDGARSKLRSQQGRWLRRVIAIAAAVGMTVGGVALAPSAAAVTPAGAVHLDATRLASFDSQMVSYVNSARKANGLPAVQQASGLTSLAVWWSTQMANGATGGNLQHNPNAFQQVTKYGAANRTAWGENVAKFTPNASAKAVFDAYMNSPGHRANILSTKYRYIGMGTVSNGSAAFNTMEFTDLIEAATKTPVKAAVAKPATKPAAKPATKTATKPAVKAATKPAAKPAAKTASKPATKAATKATVKSAEDAVAVVKKATGPATAAQPVLPRIAHGVVAASFGKFPASGMTVEIRDAQCHKVIARAATTTDGQFPASLMPGRYCATLISGPGGVERPASVPFTVQSGTAFSVAFANLTAQRSTAHSRFVMQPR